MVPLAGTEPAPQLSGDIPGDVRLHLQQVRRLPVVLFAPELRAIRRVDQLDADYQIVAALRNPPGHNGLDTERPRDLLEIDGLTLVRERRAPGDDLDPWQLRETVDERLADAVG